MFELDRTFIELCALRALSAQIIIGSRGIADARFKIPEEQIIRTLTATENLQGVIAAYSRAINIKARFVNEQLSEIEEEEAHKRAEHM